MESNKPSIEESIKDLLEEQELYFIVRKDPSSNVIGLECNLSHEDVGEVLFKPLIEQGNIDTFDYSTSILKSLVEGLEEVAGSGAPQKKPKDRYN